MKYLILDDTHGNLHVAAFDEELCHVDMVPATHNAHSGGFYHIVDGRVEVERQRGMESLRKGPPADPEADEALLEMALLEGKGGLDRNNERMLLELGLGEVLATTQAKQPTARQAKALQQEEPTTARKAARRKLTTLTCCCCGNGTKGRQWWNRDTGYGLCDECIGTCGVGGVAPGEVADAYGVRGRHWDTKEGFYPRAWMRTPQVDASATGVALRHTGNGHYHRDAGAWGVYAEWQKQDSGTYALVVVAKDDARVSDNVVGLHLYECSRQAWADDNGKYAGHDEEAD